MKLEIKMIINAKVREEMLDYKPKEYLPTEEIFINNFKLALHEAFIDPEILEIKKLE